jgi:hypothetical protein
MTFRHSANVALCEAPRPNAVLAVSAGDAGDGHVGGSVNRFAARASASSGIITTEGVPE